MFQNFTKAIAAFVLLSLSVAVKAQTNIASYKFARTTGATYTTLTGDSTVFSGSYDDDVSAAIPLGGSFTFGGTAYTACYINTNGYLTFGAASSNSGYTPLSTTASTVLGAVAAYAQDAGGSTVTGAAPKISILRTATEFIVQYQDHSNYYNRASDRMNFQIRLNLSSGTINIVYGTCTLVGTSTSGTPAQVGLRGNTTTWLDNVNNLLLPNIPSGTTCNWADAVTGNTNSSGLVYSAGVNPNITIPVGLTYTWTPAISPAPVRTFYAVSNITPSGAKISWAPVSGATQYNVQYRVLGSCSWTNFGSNPVTGDTTATLTGLSSATVYQVRVQAGASSSVSIWSHIPTSAGGTGTNGYIVAGTFTTAATCTVPTAVAVGSITTSSASVSFTATGSSFIVEYGAAGFTPGTGATAGTGGTVVTGTASPVAISGLSSGTTYDVYVRQNCISAGNGYSANTAKVTFNTNCTPANVPYSENFDGVTAPALPPCIVIENVNGATTWVNTAATVTGLSSPNVMQYTWDGSTAADDWFFVKGLNLTAGTNYLLTFKYANNSTTYVEKLEVKVGTAATAASAAVGTQVFNNANITGSVTSNGSGIFTPTITGTYYFGFHAYSAANQFNLYVDDIKVDIAPACPTPTATSIGSITTNSAKVNFTSAGSSFIAEYSTNRFTPGTGATAGTGGTIVTGTSSPISLTGLTLATKYYVYLRQNCSAAGNGYSTNVFVDSFTTAAAPPPANDSCAGAINLSVSNGFCSSPVLGTLAYADSTTGLGAATCASTALKYDVWYKVSIPATGNVTVQTSAVNTTVTDLVLQAYSGSCGLLTLIGCDDDGNPLSGPSAAHAKLGLTGRTPGEVVYFRVMPYSSTSMGAFSICAFDTTASVAPSVAAGSRGTCTNAMAVVADSAWKYALVPLKDASGNIIAELYPNGNLLGNTTASFYINGGAVRRDPNSIYYLDRNITITPTNQPSTSIGSVTTRLYFTNAELTAFAAAAGATTRSQLNVTKTTQTCVTSAVAAGGGILLTQSASAAYGADNYVEVLTPSFSTFYLHKGTTALPIKFEYLTGKKIGNTNALNWKVTCTSTSITMVLERSADARTFDRTITTINATQARCGQPFDAVDATPLNGISYYRLKMIDVDGKVSYSPVAAVMNGKAGAELVGIYPTVVKDQAYLSITSSRNTTMQFSISDMTGKVVTTISQAVGSGSSLLPVSTASLASGVYNITGLLDGTRTQTLRFVKQ